MELRSQPRFEIHEPVQVTVLAESEATFLGQIRDYSARGLGFLSHRPIAPGTAVKFEWRSTLVLGEVKHCRRDRDGFMIGASVEHVLHRTDELARLARRLFEEETRSVEIPREK